MKSLFDPNVFQETVKRVEALQPSAPRQWGKMTPPQMLEHAARVAEMACGKGPQKQIWPGKLFSWTFRRNFLGEEPSGEQGCNGNVHTFFGRLSGTQWGETQYKHLDHHLRQFVA